MLNFTTRLLVAGLLFVPLLAGCRTVGSRTSSAKLTDTKPSLPPTSAIPFSCRLPEDGTRGCYDLSGSIFRSPTVAQKFCGQGKIAAGPCSSQFPLLGSCLMFAGKSDEQVWRLYRDSEELTVKQDAMAAEFDDCLERSDSEWIPNK